MSFEDEESGLEFDLAPGERPRLAANPRVARLPGGERRIEVFAPTAEEAVRRLKKYAGVVAAPEQLTGNAVEGARYTFDFVVFESAKSEILQAIAKIALAYLCELGVAVPPTSPALRFVRGLPVTPLPVAPCQGDVVKLNAEAGHPCTHSIHLFSPADSSHLFARVVLFEFAEYLVLLADDWRSSGWLAPYAYSVVSACEQQRGMTWVAATTDLLAWMASPRLDTDRLKSRLEHVMWWVARPIERRVARAMTVASKAFFASVDAGASAQDAELRAQAVMNEQLEQHGLTAKIEVSPRTPSS